METATELSPREKIEAACKDLGLSLTAEFVPFSKSRNAAPREDGKVWRSLNWRVTLLRQDFAGLPAVGVTPRAILTTDYGAGEGHCPASKASIKALGNRNSIVRDKCIAWECENGRKARYLEGMDILLPKGGDPLLPETAAVIASLVMDSDVIDCGTFEEWASNLGYNPDSRKAGATYRACLEIALKLRNGLGEDGLKQLRDACQDY